MSYSTRIKVIELDNGFQVMCEILHSLDTHASKYLQNNVASPENYITQIAFRLNGDIQAEMLLGRHVSNNPVVGTRFAKLKKGDEISVSWQDISGDGGQHTSIVR